MTAHPRHALPLVEHRRHGGRVTGSVSGKTDFLLVGTQCGKSKLGAVRNIPID